MVKSTKGASGMGTELGFLRATIAGKKDEILNLNERLIDTEEEIIKLKDTLAALEAKNEKHQVPLTDIPEEEDKHPEKYRGDSGKVEGQGKIDDIWEVVSFMRKELGSVRFLLGKFTGERKGDRERKERGCLGAERATLGYKDNGMVVREGGRGLGREGRS